jgi:trans-L-3-hydroxyproline dehydratase
LDKKGEKDDVETIWMPPDDWIKIKTIEAHAAGEPLRVVVAGFPTIPGDTILERRRYLKNHLDFLRTALVWEPRGHADMYGAIPTAPINAGSDVGVIFLHNEGYSTMCGHGVIALVTVLLETGMIAKDGDHPTIKLDTPAG